MPREPLRGPLSKAGLQRLAKTYAEAARLTRENADALVKRRAFDGWEEASKILADRAAQLEIWVTEIREPHTLGAPDDAPGK